MKEIDLANNIKEILSTTEQRKLRYASELNWIERWQKLWASDRIRVGVIGVTSSGKSTLINALLGDNLLSVAVRPSSSQLVSCSYAKKRSAVVYFLNGDKKNINDTAELKNTIIQYSDENYNKRNQKQVAQLELSTPKFDLGEDVLLVDSPGLDASGYEIHEKLTLETLLPTVDIVIFVTTVKSEVDKKMKQTLDTIAKYNCPLMIVQNMLDAVRPSVDGKKSASTVAKERMNRVLLTVDQSAIKNKNEVKVAQISAINAMNYRSKTNPSEEEKKAFIASRYENFVTGVKELIKTKRPEIEDQRVKTILEHFYELIQQENERTENLSISLPVDTSLNSIKYDISHALDDTYDAINSVILELQEMYNKYFPVNDTDTNDNQDNFFTRNFLNTFIPNKFKRNYEFDESDITEIKNTVKSFESKVAESVSIFSDKCAATIKKLKLPTRDLWSYNGMPRMPEVSVKTKIITKTKLVDKDGFWNMAKRFFDWGDKGWGKETVQYTESVIDNEATKESVRRYIQRVKNEYAKTLENWHANANSTVVSIQQEVDLRIAAIKEKEKQVLDANDWKQIRKDLEKCFKQYVGQARQKEKTTKTYVNKVTDIKDTTKLIKVQYKYVQLYDAAEKYLYAVQKSTFNYAMQIKQRENRPAIVISNSSDNLSDFLFRFYQIKKTDFENKQIYYLTDKLSVACAPTEIQLKSIFKDTRGLNVFLLINGLQFHTEFETSLRKKVQENLSDNDALFLTVQDFEVLANGNAISECLRSIRMEQCASNGLILISHNNPIYNISIIHAQTTDVKLKEETMFYNALTSKFPKLVNEVTKKRINNILRS